MQAHPALPVRDAVIEVQGNPETAVPLLTDVVADKKRERNFRVNCAQMLREIGTPVSPAYWPKLEETIKDNSEDAVIRIDAAYFLLRADKQLSTTTKNFILDIAERFLRDGTERAHVRMMIMRQMVGNPRATDIMLNQINRGIDLGPSIHVLGKLKDQRAIDPIARLLEAHRKERQFPRTRAYLALGEIGGRKTYDILIQCLPKEQDETEQHSLLLGIGLSRDSRAKAMLLGLLKKPESYMAAVDGLRYYGDKSVVPVLEAELQRKDLSETRKYVVRRTIDALEKGETTPVW
jgi:HEAT repeat protein